MTNSKSCSNSRLFPCQLYSLLFILLPQPGYSGEVLKSHVEDEGDHYLLHIEMRIEADAKSVYQRLTDFDNLHKVSRTVTSSKILSRQGNKSRVEVNSQGCALLVCRSLKQIQVATELGQGYIMIVDEPVADSFSYGHTLWRVWPDGKSTRVNFSADMVPDFWLPPLIGPWVFKDKMLEEGQALINGLEEKPDNEQKPENRSQSTTQINSR